MEGRVAYLEGHTCGFCMHLLGPITIFEHILGGRTCGDTSCYSWRYIFYYFMEFWHGQNPNSPLSPWICLVEMVHLLFWGFDYFISCGVLHLLGILHIHPWSWLPWDSHMWIGCMHLVDLLLFLEEVVMEHSPRRIIILFILSCILEGALSEFS
jgi:hypothetical protein